MSRPARPTGLDVLVFVLLLAWALAEALLVAGPGSAPSRVALAVAFTAPLLARRWAPGPMLLLVCALAVGWTALTDEPEGGAMPFPVQLVLLFSIGTYVRRAAAGIAWAAAGAAGIGTMFALGYFSGDPAASDLAILPFFVAGAYAAGRVVATRARQGESDAATAVVAERARIARELHDLVGHAVSLISLQAAAADAQLERDPRRAREHLDVVQRTAREAGTEMRRLLDVLREDAPTRAPQPGLDRLPELVDELRRGGLPVELESATPPGHVPAGVDLAAFRIAQEALTNVRRHAGPVPTLLRTGYDGGEVLVEVVNAPGVPDPAAGPSGGYGLPGMRERARVYGGSVEAVPRSDGGFVVRARLPIGDPA
jgi:signal transduction histidine kinase